MNTPNVLIILVNWNAGDQLAAVVNSIVRSRGNLDTSVVIVDNASTDDSLALIEKGMVTYNFPIHIIRNEQNKGFAAACNQGALMAEDACEYLLFLNPDTLLFENSLYGPLSYLQDRANQDVGLVGIQLLDEQNRIACSCSRFPTLGIFAAQAVGLNRLPRFRHLTQTMVEWNHDASRAVDQIMGAFLMIRRSLFESLGGFDERFFVYFEEVDLCLRAYRAGYRSVFLANAQAFHAGGGTSRQVKSHRLMYSLRSRLLYGFKHFSTWQAWILLTITLSIEPVTRTLFSLIKSGPIGVADTWRAYYMLWLEMESILEKIR